MSRAETLFVFDTDTDQAELTGWLRHFAAVDIPAAEYRLGNTPVLVATGAGVTLPPPGELPQPVGTVESSGEFRLGRRALRPAGTVVSVGDTRIGDNSVAVFAGPCKVANRAQLLASARVAADGGAVGLSDTTFAPPDSRHSLAALRWAGLDLLSEAREETGLPVLTEVTDRRHVERLARVVDGFQIGTRDMQNFALLAEVGATGLPVILRRGYGCTVDEILAAGEHVLAQGNDQLILCERGIRTFDHATRFTLDLSAVALLKERTHLPVMVDPSHAVAVRSLVGPMTLGAAAVGADALLIDVHVRPDETLCDGNRALWPSEFEGLMTKLDLLATGLGRQLAGVRRRATVTPITARKAA
ncbi:MAG TPA: 3-deoxy-7-phosphoheptulonate synthase [Pseudonocardiaceae bacterium]|nr:3-deoxy-7-phosphoheptulonate synthase [Pseudonocardiaceae bacterium]